MTPRAWKRLLPLALFLSLPACRSTTSTEVGVRTNLFGLFEKRGEQQIYAPGGIYLVLPIVNSFTVLPISQQNLLMNADPHEGDRPVPDDITFKTKDGNNVYIDVNLMWRIDSKKAGFVVGHVGQTLEEVKERVVRPISRSIIRDVFNEITSEEYYQVTVKNRVAAQAKDQLSAALAPFGVAVDMLQLHQHRFDPEYQEAINAQKQAEADVQMLIERQKAAMVQKQTELEARRSEWNQSLETARGEAGRARNEADGYYQTQTNQAKAIRAAAQAEADGIRKEAEALSKLGGDAYVKIQVAKLFAEKRIYLVPGSNVSTLDVNSALNFLLKDAAKK
ncbi:MAG TPA: SPFH domain-containing protein [Anaeromyxobacter sp.]|nr:SPFH domain-containing protein [Anaeromyxobacter sp.]